MIPKSLRFLVAVTVLLAAVPAFAEGPIDLNTASEDELASLPGVGAATARRIVEYRQQNGPFQAVSDLENVKGIGSAVFERLKDGVTVGAGRTVGSTSVIVTGVTAQEGEASPAAVKKLLSRYKEEPSVRGVQEAAMRYAEVHPELIQSWRTRSRLAALGPQIRGEYRYVYSIDQRGREGGGTAPTLQDDEGYEHRPTARAQWDLDRLIFNPDELRVSNEIVDLVRLRESVLDQVTKIYFERRRLQVDLDLTPPKDIAGRVRKELRLQELVADMDSLTGGYFSKKLTESGLDPY